MIRWCSYCQRFIGESAPYDNFSWTDGICITCKRDGKAKQQEFSPEFEAKVRFFRLLRAEAVEGKKIDPMEILALAEKQGIAKIEIIVGLLQPILNELGILYSQGKVSTVEEHQFSHTVEQILQQLESEFASKTKGKKEQVIFASANSNYHTIGLRMLTLAIQNKGIGVRCVTPSVPANDLIKLCVDIRPDVLGISLSLENQTSYVKEVLSGLGTSKPKLTAIGGPLLKQIDLQFDSSIYIANIRDHDEIIERIVSACTPSSLP